MPDRDEFSRRIGAKEARKLRSRRRRRNGWGGFGAFGFIGWAVVVPILLGIAAGLWIDEHYPGHFSWTLMLLAAGLGIGCYNAWRWMSAEREAIRREQENNRHA
jgi:ATP synthase protein I